MEKILFLSGNLFPCRAGDSIYSAGVLENLTENYELDVLFFARKNDFLSDKDYLRIRQKCKNMKHVIYNKLSRWDVYELGLKYGHLLCQINDKFIDEIVEKLKNNQYDYLIIDHLRMYAAYMKVKSFIDSQTKIVLINHNVEFINMQEMIKFEENYFRKVKSMFMNRGIKDYEINAVRNVDILWTLSKGDLDTLIKVSHFQGRKKVISPYFNYPKIKEKQDLKNNTYNLLFLGSMSWYPNVIGVRYFIENIFNKVLEIDNRYKLYIVGNNPHKSLLKYASDKIIITGGVDSVDQYIKNCDFLVMPNRLGSGVKIKVLEALLKGIPIIGFKEGLNGYPEELFDEGFCVENDNAFVQSIIKLNSDAKKKYAFIAETQKRLRKSVPIKIEG